MDLTGRFPERYARVRSRWERFLADLMNVLLYSRKEVTEERIEGSYSPFVSQRVEYVVESKEIWAKFTAKWRPSCGLVDLHSYAE